MARRNDVVSGSPALNKMNKNMAVANPQLYLTAFCFQLNLKLPRAVNPWPHAGISPESCILDLLQQHSQSRDEETSKHFISHRKPAKGGTSRPVATEHHLEPRGQLLSSLSDDPGQSRVCTLWLLWQAGAPSAEGTVEVKALRKIKLNSVAWWHRYITSIATCRLEQKYPSK